MKEVGLSEDDPISLGLDEELCDLLESSLRDNH